MKFRLPISLAAAVLALGTSVAYASPTPSSTDEARALVRTTRTADVEENTANAQRHAEEMMKGKDHQAAWDATHSSANGEKMALRGRRHVDAMMQGKDHEAARDAASR
ncbi:hypothetical protein [Anaeromyxobacter oryzae]|uniref:Lipoprotein n=1 Tax=Anaeromyxobacter oryzae TaxID=2918170 RepID=A0ABN6MN18_9BACT|nr:hypothetical protein [Anaeromyxobacter oryzae]BDG02408.1 hypothetical protein AMOR_14040 [Anaeromyxobacter oryzae]